MDKVPRPGGFLVITTPNREGGAWYDWRATYTFARFTGWGISCTAPSS